MFRYSVLGAGRQGVAIAYDLIKHGEAETVRLADVDPNLVQNGAERVNRLTATSKCHPYVCNASDPNELRKAISGSQGVVSALPYFLNLQAATVAVSEKAHFCDLGGNTDIVMQELKLDPAARKSGTSLLPDCGLAPGLSNLLAARVLNQMDRVDSIRARCGGLPQKPRPPLNYKFVFSLHGLINEYSGDAIFLRQGKIAKVPALSELESLRLPGLGTLEAAVTTGGTSTAPYTFKGKVKNFDYKTLRYPGHFAAFRAYAELGLFAQERRPFFFELLTPLIDFPADRDRVILLVDGEGRLKRKKRRYRALLIDNGDVKTGLTAMERTTGFPTAVIAHLQASGKIASGAKPIESAVPLDDFMISLKKRGITIKESLK
jgi:lysine 6-dehydrogenase